MRVVPRSPLPQTYRLDYFSSSDCPRDKEGQSTIHDDEFLLLREKRIERFVTKLNAGSSKIF